MVVVPTPYLLLIAFLITISIYSYIVQTISSLSGGTLVEALLSFRTRLLVVAPSKIFLSKLGS